MACQGMGAGKEERGMWLYYDICSLHLKAVACMQRGMAQLPDLHVSDSSEAMLSGRKPPFRLLVRAVASDGRKVNIRHAVSEGFVVRCWLEHPLHA